ncbi:Heme oxygenase 2 [Asimina triloba]
MLCSPATLSYSSFELALHSHPFPTRLQSSSSHFHHLPSRKDVKLSRTSIRRRNPSSFRFSCCSDVAGSNLPSSAAESPKTPTPVSRATNSAPGAAGVKKKKRYRREYPGESKGIVEEMRFVAMRLRNDKSSGGSSEREQAKQKEEEESRASDAETWQPSIKGFLRYLVDSKLVFETLDNIIEESDHVSNNAEALDAFSKYMAFPSSKNTLDSPQTDAYFRNTGLERSERLSRDLEWFGRQGILIPEPSSPGVSYAQYLNKLATKSAPLFLCHFYNIYFAHIAGGQVIVKKVCDQLVEGREMEFSKWDGDVQELLKDTRENLNKLAVYWSREEKNKCLRETEKLPEEICTSQLEKPCKRKDGLFQGSPRQVGWPFQGPINFLYLFIAYLFNSKMEVTVLISKSKVAGSRFKMRATVLISRCLSFFNTRQPVATSKDQNERTALLPIIPSKASIEQDADGLRLGLAMIFEPSELLVQPSDALLLIISLSMPGIELQFNNAENFGPSSL